ncbi:MAG: ATP-binding protein [Thermodesulfobacteriota bacterium]
MMTWLPRLVARTPVTVYTKLNWAFLAIVALLIAFGGLGLVVLNESNQRTEDLVKLQRKIAAYRQLQHDTTSQLYSITSALLTPNDTLLESALRQLNQYRYNLDRVQFVSKGEVELFRKIQREHERLTQVVTQVVELTRAGRVYEAMELRHSQTNPVSDRLERLTNEMVNRAEADIVAKADESRRSFLVSQWMVISFGLSSVGLALLLGYAISKSLMGPVMKMDDSLARISSGDFSHRITVPNRDELGDLAEHLNRMSEELRGLYHQIEMASSYKSEFLANVSHELRTPLNAIIGYSELLMEEAEDKGEEDFIPDLKRIQTSGKHLLALINDILDLSKIEAGKVELSPEIFNIENMVHEVVSTVEPMARKNNNTLQIHCNEALGQMYADKTRVRQILFNLLSNACKFTEQGSVTLDTVRETGKNFDWLNISVKDTGIGMTEEQMSKLYQPFSQLGEKGSKKYDGTGLGLVITKQFCTMMGGNIAVTSEYGSGSTFTLRLPMDGNHAGVVEIPALHT